ncbi:MAG: hypothetical protein JNL38_07640, partial [Myxococcales bacterium]|nr:hypothetical protein [Myxococcales bacterium]
NFIGQVCHIEAAQKGGERFNDAMSDEDRRAFENLMLMCYEHHVATDDVDKYPVATLRKFKADHERRFSSPERAILATLKDWTTAETPQPPKNLRRANRVLNWKNGTDELAEMVQSLGEYINTFGRVPMSVRSFLGKVAERAHRLGKSPAVSTLRGVRVACSDLEAAFQMSPETVARQAEQLAMYELGGIDSLDIDGRAAPAVLIRERDGWSIWRELAKFCASEPVPMEAFTEELDFSSLDE